MRDRKTTDKSSIIPKKRGNGIVRREIWTDAQGKVTRYNLAYINLDITHHDNGRVIGYDNSHSHHHRHCMGKVEQVDFHSFPQIEARFVHDLIHC